MKTFENKTVVITGGTSGIGKATAMAFSKEGANVVVSGRRIAEGENVVREITSAGGKALFVQTDVGREEDIIALSRKLSRASAPCTSPSTMPAAKATFGLLTTEQTVEHYDKSATSIFVASCCR